MIRHSTAERGEGNLELEDRTDAYRERGNAAFFADAHEQLGGPRIAIGLIGTRDIPGIALRRAQSVLRWDLRPSLWSHAFLVVDGARVREVTLHSYRGEFPDPAYNGVLDAEIADYDDPDVIANAALLAVPLPGEENGRVLDRAVGDPNLDRARYDLWTTLGVWQTYLWSAGAADNPLREGWPIAASSFVEYCFEAVRLDVSPGATERNSSPEHLWNGAKWWHAEFAAVDHPIAGAAVLRDKCAVLMDPPARPPYSAAG